MDALEIKQLLEAGIPGAEVTVDGDGTHFAARIVSDAFADLTPVKRHQLVYGALGDRVGGAIHALSIQAYTPEEWRRQQPFQAL